ncbi:MAG: exodeoxyribonuclease VII large subunit [Candidatus Endobugula sp.]|jgi:exodeoxyribonuclease VII large subunit
MNNSPKTDKQLLSVSQLNRRAKQLLETHLALVWVSGEISNLAKPSSGHWYFSLKDSHAQVRCAMFKGANQRVRWTPESGQQVSIRARVSLYEGRGEYQLIVEHMNIAGDGQLQQQYEQLKDTLEAEGLFSEEHKQPLPRYPQHIGVITSPTGAAVHDIISVLKRRYPIATVSIFPVSVQGVNAAPEIIAGIQQANLLKQCDVLILSRGGGSIEDLWAFNNEALARTIYQSDIPIISAVGHEVDFTIADFVADVRAPTPSVSAEIATPDYLDLFQLIDYYQDRLQRTHEQRLHREKERLTFLRKRLRHPGQAIRNQQQQVKYFRQAIISATGSVLQQRQTRFERLAQRLLNQHPKKQLGQQKDRVTGNVKRLHSAIEQLIDKKQQQLARKAAVLDAISPLTVLSRGYSITRKHDGGTIVKNSRQLSVGDSISTKLSDGHIESTVTNIPHRQHI